MNTRLDELKCETFISIDIKLSTINQNKSPFSHEKPSSDLIKWPLFKSPEKYPHASQFTKHIYCVTLEGDALLQIKNDGMPLFLPSANIYQQIRAGHQTNISKQNITTYPPFSNEKTFI